MSQEFRQGEINATYEFCRKYFGKTRKAIDIGCDVFEFAGKLVNDFEHTYCFDFRDKSSQMGNHINDKSKVTFYHTGLGEKEITRYTKPGVGRIKADVEPVGNSNMAVNIRTLDSYDLGNEIDFIKLDVEGYEPKIIQGAMNTIKNNRPVILCEINRGDFTAKEMLESLGYTCADVYHKLGQPHDYLFVPDPILL
jgi:FkbM family methyltransferase